MWKNIFNIYIIKWNWLSCLQKHSSGKWFLFLFSKHTSPRSWQQEPNLQMDDKMAIVVCSKAGNNTELLASTGGSSPISRLDTHRKLLRESKGGIQGKPNWNFGIDGVKTCLISVITETKEAEGVHQFSVYYSPFQGFSVCPHPILHPLGPLKQRHPSLCSLNSLTFTSSGGQVP